LAETLDEEEDDAAEEKICLGFFTLAKGAKNSYLDYYYNWA
jgi:hypothetical protein